MSYIEDAFATFHDADGNPLDDGYIYIGTAGLDPETNPKSVYSDFGLTTSVAQPIRTVGGRAVADDGTTTINIYVAGEYSITIRDSDSTLVTVALTAEGIIDYMPKTGGTFTGSIGGTSATFTGDGSFEKIRLTGTGDASATSTAHAFQIGSTTGLNVIIDTNEIIARDNGSLGTFYIGGASIFVGENTSTVSFRGDVDFRSGSSSDFASGSTVDFNQEWESVSGSRVGNASYTNSTGKPIMVAISGTNSTGGALIPRVSTDGSSWVGVGFIADGDPFCVSFIVPNGHEYELNASAGGSPSYTWSELR